MWGPRLIGTWRRRGCNNVNFQVNFISIYSANGILQCLLVRLFKRQSNTMNGAQNNSIYGLTDQSNVSSGSNNADVYNDSGMIFEFSLNIRWAWSRLSLFLIVCLLNAYSLSLANFYLTLVPNISVNGFVQ